MKRVLIFSLGYFPKAVGGAEVAIKEKTDRMQDAEFHLITNRYDSTLPKVEQVGNVLVHRIGITTENPSIADLKKYPLHFNKFLFQFLAAWKAIQLHRQYTYDCTWAMMAHSSGVPAAIFKLFNPKVPYVLELQEGDPLGHIERTMRPLWPLFSLAFTKADVVSVISTFLGRWAHTHGFEGKTVLVPNGVSIELFSRAISSEEIVKIQDALGKKPDDVFVITTSRLVHKNAVDDVIRALPLLPEKIHFIVLGVGPDELQLRTLADSLKVAHRVRFVGQVGHADLPTYLKASDIFIRPSRSEGMGNSFIEAMAARIPVIATQEGGIADFIFDEVRNPDTETTGFAVDKDSPEQIAQAIQVIMQNPDKVARVKETAFRMVSENYSWDKVSRLMYEQIFKPLF